MENIALLKPTSTRNKRGEAEYAVDGEFNNNIIAFEEVEQWWSVDLRKQTMVTHLTIYKVGRLAAELIVGLTDTPLDDSDGYSDYTLCAIVSVTERVKKYLVSCQPSCVSGRYLFVRWNESSTKLRLAEVQVYAVLPNLARGRPPWRSTAVEGPVLAGPYSCSEVDGGDVTWWTDLGEGQHIAAVYLRLEQTDPDGSRLTVVVGVLYIPGIAAGDVIIAVTEVRPTKASPGDLADPSSVLCSVVTSRFTGLARCDVSDVYGRYVFVKARPKTTLKLCEVEVFATRE
ncbi:hypothetical protein NP493_328g03002 [Ridgeia piscesae]|uniref:F5/8 type C domain-containing protein n=1 Tax=Ridgeia piscesae TaxID=27915 RepID=A0AAD9L4M1_RIDPI|nr:hypothetical protein NP493_328g03002 [Ridgeia piscesae]